jgi:hypothetical protein
MPPSESEAEDKAITVRISHERYSAIVSEAKAARHSINSSVTFLLEEALMQRGKWNHPKELPFWRREKNK